MRLLLVLVAEAALTWATKPVGGDLHFYRWLSPNTSDSPRLKGRQDLVGNYYPGYNPEFGSCGSGKTCADACGSDFEACKASTSLSLFCYNPKAKQTCCANGSGRACEDGYYCAWAEFDGRAYCCRNGQTLKDCGVPPPNNSTTVTGPTSTTTTTQTQTLASETITSTTTQTETLASETIVRTTTQTLTETLASETITRVTTQTETLASETITNYATSTTTLPGGTTGSVTTTQFLTVTVTTPIGSPPAPVTVTVTGPGSLVTVAITVTESLPCSLSPSSTITTITTTTTGSSTTTTSPSPPPPPPSRSTSTTTTRPPHYPTKSPSKWGYQASTTPCYEVVINGVTFSATTPIVVPTSTPAATAGGSPSRRLGGVLLVVALAVHF